MTITQINDAIDKLESLNYFAHTECARVRRQRDELLNMCSALALICTNYPSELATAINNQIIHKLNRLQTLALEEK